MTVPEARRIPAWTRRLPGSSVLAFVFLSGGLWTACLLAWEVRQPELVVLLLAVGAFLPVLWLGVRLWTHPLWALQVAADRRTVAGSLRAAVRDRRPTEITPEEAGREGVFRGCEILLRVEEPACIVGVRRSSGEPWTTLLLLPRSRDRSGLDRLRETIAARVASA